jgi:hypothetical protein
MKTSGKLHRAAQLGIKADLPPLKLGSDGPAGQVNVL